MPKWPKSRKTTKDARPREEEVELGFKEERANTKLEEVNIKEEREQDIVEVVSTNLEAGITKRELVTREE